MGNSSTIPISTVEFPLPSDIIFEILLRVDDKSLCKCRLINKEFYSIINKQSFWMERCGRYGVLFPKFSNSSGTSNGVGVPKLPNYHLIYQKRPYGRNLIKNPSGEDGKKFWNNVLNAGEGFRVEKPPSGADPTDLASGMEFPSCFATSYRWCVKEQLIDLVEEGCETHILDELMPKITVSEWTAARFDCASTHVFRVLLLRKKRCPERHDFKSIFSRSQGLYFHSQSDDQDSTDTDNDDDDEPPDSESPIIDSIELATFVAQWAGRTWKKVSHVFQNYGPGLRYIAFQSIGKDDQYWAGFYGPKTAKSSMILTFD